jgi:hypothetical protein
MDFFFQGSSHVKFVGSPSLGQFSRGAPDFTSTEAIFCHISDLSREVKRSKIFYPENLFQTHTQKEGTQSQGPLASRKTNGHKKYEPLVCMNSAAPLQSNRLERGAEPEPLKMQISKLLCGRLFWMCARGNACDLPHPRQNQWRGGGGGRGAGRAGAAAAAAEMRCGRVAVACGLRGRMVGAGAAPLAALSCCQGLERDNDACAQTACSSGATWFF